jgi:hypothetical protein
VDSETYFFYEWLIIEKQMTEEKLETLTLDQKMQLSKEYSVFKSKINKS